MDEKCDDLKSRFLPVQCWVGEQKKAEVQRADLIAGINVAQGLIPQSKAYAQRAAQPPNNGL